MIPQLRDLEATFHGHLVVIGVHSAKYTTEGRAVHLAQAVRRLGIHHPVVSDRERRVWSEYAVRAWPTLMFVGPDGRVIGKHEGEFDPADMEATVRQILDEAGAAGALRDAPFDPIEAELPLSSTLAFPTAVQVDETRLYIADTAHHRIVVAGLGGRIEMVVGDGQQGLRDGPPEVARFHAPHGLAIHDGRLFVADTENHAIRAVDLEAGQISTVAGTGVIARSYGSGGPALETPLRSPWDLTVVDGTLFIAMAGNHQLWMQRLGSDEIRRFAGTGHEGKRDDRVPRAWLAQPSGIAPYRDVLLFADAETSSVRSAAVTSDGDVDTLVGEDLFDWGDVDGALDQALLQHATGVAWDRDSDLIYVSDTYNNKIKRIDLAARLVTTIAGTGNPAHADGPGDVAAFFEPHGLAISNGKLYIADTNNHAVRILDLGTRTVSTMRFE